MLSLVLATVGRVDEVERLVQTLLSQTVRDFELIVVDQNQDDRLLPLAATAANGGISVQHLRLHPPNLSAARNLGVERARGSVIGFPDDDCWYEPETVEHVLSAMSTPQAPGGVVGCWVEQTGDHEQPTPRPGPLSAEDWSRFRGGDASSITLFFRSSILRQVGGFDVEFGVGRWFGCGEETDLVLRVLRSGLRMERVPAILVHHRWSNTKEALSLAALRRSRSRGRGAGGLYAKHALSLMVIWRGLLSGWIKPIVRFEGVGAALLGIAESFGRLEGYLRWKLDKSFRPTRRQTQPR